MHHLKLPPCTVVSSETHYEIELLKQPSVEAEFSSSEEESEYQQADARLAEKIQAVARAACGSQDSEDLIHTNWDWYPTKSRCLELDEKVFSQALVQSLIQLLEGAYADWRIYLNVYKSLSKDSQNFGVACLFEQRIVIQKSLYKLFHPM